MKDAVSIKQTPRDDRIELILCRHEMNTGICCEENNHGLLDLCGEKGKKKTYNEWHAIHIF